MNKGISCQVLLLSALVRGMVLKKKIGSRTRIRKIPRMIAAQKAKEDFPETALQILKIDNFFNEMLHTAALRPAARLLLYIMVKRSVSIKQAMLDSPLSYRAFYIMIERLKDESLLAVKSDDEDRRVRRLVLGRQFDRILEKLPYFLEKDDLEITPVK
jgi:DNA-binding MarR family transcriptional regulator